MVDSRGDKEILKIPENIEATVFCTSGERLGACSRDLGSKGTFFNSLGASKLSQINDSLKTAPQEKKLEKFSNEIFLAYCSNGKQQLPMVENVSVVLPKLPQGIPLDWANEASKKLNIIAEETVLGFLFQIPIQTTSFNQYDGARFLGFKTLKDKPSDIFLDQRIRPFQAANGEGKLYNHFVAIADGNDITIGWIEDFIEYRSIHSSFFGYDGYEISKDSEAQKIDFTFGYGLKRSYYDYDGLDHPLIGLKRFNNESMVFTTLYYTDLFALRSAYVLLKKDEDGNINISKSIQNQSKNWHEYLTKNISLKSAQSDNPQILKYTISLDLNDFCQNARPVSSLKSN